MKHSQLVSVSEFRKAEPAFKSDYAVYAAARSIPELGSVRIGRRVFIDLLRWEEFKRTGGRALPGGWRREAR